RCRVGRVRHGGPGCCRCLRADGPQRSRRVVSPGRSPRARRHRRALHRSRGPRGHRDRRGGPMTDPLALDPILGPTERSALPFNDADLSHDARYEAFEAHVVAGGKVEPTDWMPDEYRTAVLRFVEMHANSEL